jgi:hypothetical protein
MVKRRRTFNGIAAFPWGLPISASSLGAKYRVRVGGLKINFDFPIENQQSRTLAAPASVQAIRGGTDTDSVRWGHKATEAVCHVNAVGASVLLTPEDNLRESSEFEQLDEGFPEWFEIVQAWTEAWTGIPIGQIGAMEGPALYLPVRDDQWVQTTQRGLTLVASASHLTDEQVGGAFRRASQGERPPIEYSMTASARISLIEGDTRRSIIDSATAVEMALSAAISDVLKAKRQPPEFIKDVLYGANGAVGLRKICTSLGLTPPISKTKVKADVAEVRNLAVHQGKVPTFEQANSALMHAEALVAFARPLPIS